LRAWLDGRGVAEPIYLCYFGMADPRYHQIRHINMPGGYGMEPQEEVRAGGGDPSRSFVISNMERPGLLAISATARAGVYLGPQGRLLWNEVLRDATLIDTIGYSMFVYAVRPSLRPTPETQPTR
jgi:hypothetical protein